MRTTKTAKASIIRIAPPIVEEPSESLEPLKELFEKEETAYRLSFTNSSGIIVLTLVRFPLMISS